MTLMKSLLVMGNMTEDFNTNGQGANKLFQFMYNLNSVAINRRLLPINQ